MVSWMLIIPATVLLLWSSQFRSPCFAWAQHRVGLELELHMPLSNVEDAAKMLAKRSGLYLAKRCDGDRRKVYRPDGGISHYKDWEDRVCTSYWVVQRDSSLDDIKNMASLELSSRAKAFSGSGRRYRRLQRCSVRPGCQNYEVVRFPCSHGHDRADQGKNEACYACEFCTTVGSSRAIATCSCSSITPGQSILQTGCTLSSRKGSLAAMVRS